MLVLFIVLIELLTSLLLNDQPPQHQIQGRTQLHNPTALPSRTKIIARRAAWAHHFNPTRRDGTSCSSRWIPCPHTNTSSTNRRTKNHNHNKIKIKNIHTSCNYTFCTLHKQIKLLCNHAMCWLW